MPERTHIRYFYTARYLNIGYIVFKDVSNVDTEINNISLIFVLFKDGILDDGNITHTEVSRTFTNGN